MPPAHNLSSRELCEGDEPEERPRCCPSSCPRRWPGARLGNKVFRVAGLIAVPNCIAAAALAAIKKDPTYSAEVDRLTVSTEVFTSFSFLVGLFLAFRASQAYYRSWEGATATFHVMADIFDVASSLVSFSKSSKAERHLIKEFHHILVRLFSVLHALMAAELESFGEVTGSENAFRFELIDASGLDEVSLSTLAASPHKVDLVLHWVQSLVVQAMEAEIITVPAPVLSRAFQELSSAMVQYHTALRIVEVPFPQPYKVATELILLIHYCLTPMAAGEWTDSVISAAFIAFVQVFMLRSLNTMAAQLDNPFGTDENDLPMEQMHMELNSRLLLLLYDETQRVPTISTSAKMHMARMSEIALEPGGRIRNGHLLHSPDEPYVTSPKGASARSTRSAKPSRKDKRRHKKGTRRLDLATLFNGAAAQTSRAAQPGTSGARQAPSVLEGSAAARSSRHSASADIKPTAWDGEEQREQRLASREVRAGSPRPNSLSSAELPEVEGGAAPGAWAPPEPEPATPPPLAVGDDASGASAAPGAPRAQARQPLPGEAGGGGTEGEGGPVEGAGAAAAAGEPPGTRSCAG